MEFPRITIVTPSFNDANYLEATLRSVLKQGYPNIEYIVIDGGSTDGSVEIIKKYEQHLHYWLSEKDDGMYDAIQKGFARATGDIMGWINSDDILHTGSLFTIAELFQEFSDINWLQGLPNVMDERGRIVSAMSWPELSKLYFYKRSRDKRKYLQQESIFWRRCLWERAGGFMSTKYRFAGDFELWMRFFQYERLFHVKACLGSFRTSSEGQASVEHFDAYLEEVEKILGDFPLTPGEQKKLAQIEVIDAIERRFNGLIHRLRKAFGGYDNSVVHDKIYFDGKSQRFRIGR